MLKASEIIKIIREAQKAGVEEIDITPEGNIKVRFLGEKAQRNQKVKLTKEQIEAMDQIAEDSVKEETFLDAEEDFYELDLKNPELVEKLIQQGDIIEKPNGELVKTN